MRSVSALVLAVFLAGPGLRAECLLLCTKPDQPAARSSCHDEPAAHPGASVDIHHDCSTIAPAVVTAVKRASTTSTVSLLATVPAPHVVSRTAQIDRPSHDPPRVAPPAAHLIPLRI